MNNTIISHLNLFSKTYPLLNIQYELNDKDDDNSTTVIRLISPHYNLSQEIEILNTIFKSVSEYSLHTILLPSLKCVILDKCHQIHFNIQYLLNAYYDKQISLYITRLRLLFQSYNVSCINNSNELYNNEELLLLFILYNYIFEYTSLQSPLTLRYFSIRTLDKDLHLTVDYRKSFTNLLPEVFYSCFEEFYIKPCCSFDSELMLIDDINNNKLLINKTDYSSIIIELAIIPSYFNQITSYLLNITIDKQLNIIVQTNKYNNVLFLLITSQCISSLIINEYKSNGYTLYINNNPKEIWIIISQTVNYNHLINNLQYFKKHEVNKCLLYLNIDQSFHKIQLNSFNNAFYYEPKENIMEQGNRIVFKRIFNDNNYTLVSLSVNSYLLISIIYAKHIELPMILSSISFIFTSHSISISYCFFKKASDFLLCLEDFNNSSISKLNNYLCDNITIENTSSELEIEIEKDSCDFPCKTLNVQNASSKKSIKLKREMRRLLPVFFAIKRKIRIMYKHRLLFIISLYLSKKTIINYISKE